MRVGAADEHAVLFDEAEPGGRLARAGEDARVARVADQRDELAAARGDAGAPREGVERHALAQQDAPHGALDGRDLHLAAVTAGGVDLGALVGVPLDGAAALDKDLVEEGAAGDDAGGFAPEGGGAVALADDEAGVVEGGCVLGEPGGDDGLPRGGEEVGEGAWRSGHCDERRVVGGFKGGIEVVRKGNGG